MPQTGDSLNKEKQLGIGFRIRAGLAKFAPATFSQSGNTPDGCPLPIWFILVERHKDADDEFTRKPVVP